MVAGMRRACGAGFALVALVCLLAGGAPAEAKKAHSRHGSIQAFTYDTGSTSYPYLVYVPPSYSRSHPPPLVVMTHGCQTTADEHMRSTLFNRVAKRAGVVALYPDVNSTEAAWPGPLRNCWDIFSGQSSHRDVGDAAAIAGMTGAVMGRWRIDPERVYMSGTSAGAYMVSTMAAAYPDLFAAVAVDAGGAYTDTKCFFDGIGIPVQDSAQLAYEEMGPRARVVPRIVMGGDADTAITPACADKALDQGLRTNNLVIGDTQDAPVALTPASVREVPKAGGFSSTVSVYLDPNRCEIGERWLIHGMEHFWPGGSTDPELHNFTDPRGPNGGAVIWQFLSRDTRSSTAMPCAEARCRAKRARAGRRSKGRSGRHRGCRSRRGR
jgi:poly(hydroxyalkanoate) depolymerase family esterase